MTDDHDERNRATHAPRTTRHFSALPPRVELADTVESVDVSGPRDDPDTDFNRDVSHRLGAGLNLG